MNPEHQAILDTMVDLNNLAFRWRKRAECRGCYFRYPKGEVIALNPEFEGFAALTNMDGFDAM